MSRPTRLLAAFVLSLLCAALLFAAGLPLTPIHFKTEYTTSPKYIPLAGEDVYVGDAYVTEIVLTNVTAGAITVTVADKQGSPLAVLKAVPIAANTTYEIAFKGRYCPAGVHWSASADNSVVATMRAEQ